MNSAVNFWIYQFHPRFYRLDMRPFALVQYPVSPSMPRLHKLTHQPLLFNLITLPDSVTEIGNEAFCKCKSLTSITFPESVTTIGHSAFACCSCLTEIEIPATVRRIGDDAFICCENLKHVRISSNFKNDIARIFSDYEYGREDSNSQPFDA